MLSPGHRQAEPVAQGKRIIGLAIQGGGGAGGGFGSKKSMSESNDEVRPVAFNAAEIGALAHLYRGEVYRSTMWRTRLDNTTNWAVVALGIAVSVTFSRPEASPLPLVLTGILMIVFLVFEARRYRYFNVWRA